MPNRRDMLKALGVSAGVTGLAGCTNPLGGGGEDPTCQTVDAEPNYGDWFENVGTYRGTCDLRDENEVSVFVGAAGGLGYYRYVPTAIAVRPGTTVTWEWTGEGGTHDVVAENEAFDSGDPVDDAGATFEFTVDVPGLYKYYCSPHRDLGMRGAVYTVTE